MSNLICIFSSSLPPSITTTRVNSFPVLQPKPKPLTTHFHPRQTKLGDDFSSKSSVIPLFSHRHSDLPIRSRISAEANNGNPYPMYETVEHIVLFKMKPNTDLDILIQELNDLRHLPGVLYLTSGYVFGMYSGNSVCGFEVFMHSRFRSKQDLDEFMCHSKTLRFMDTYVELYYEDYMVVDWVTYHWKPLVNPKVGSALRVTLFKLKDEGWGRIYEVIREDLSGAVVQQTFGQSYVGRSYRPAAKGFSIVSLGVFEGVYKLRVLDEAVEFGRKLELKLGSAVEEVMVIDYIVCTVYPQQALLGDSRASRYLPKPKLKSNGSVSMSETSSVSHQQAKSTGSVSMSKMSNVSTQQTNLPNSNPKPSSSVPNSSTQQTTLPNLKPKPTRSMSMPEMANVSTQQAILPTSKPTFTSSIPTPEIANVPISSETPPEPKPKPPGPVPLPDIANVPTSQETLPEPKPKPTDPVEMSYIPPTIIEDSIVIDKETEDEGLAFWECAVVGFFLEDNVKETWNLSGEVEISQDGNTYLFKFEKEDDQARILENHVKETWNLCGKVELSHDRNLHYFRFKNEADRAMILDEGSFLIDGKRFIVRPWTQEIEESRGVIEKVPIWVKLYNVPKHLWSVKGLSTITSFLGRPLYMDKLTEERKMLSYARVCVDVTAEKKLPEAIKIKFSSGKSATIPVEYAWKPQICTECKEFGHTNRNCGRIVPKISPIESAKPQSELLLQQQGKHEQQTKSSELDEQGLGIASTRMDHGATSENESGPLGVVERVGMDTVSVPVMIPQTEATDSESIPIPSRVSPPKESLISTLPSNNVIYAGTLLFALQFLFALGVANV